MLEDPIFFRGFERLLIILGGMFFGYLGYKLYRYGMTSGRSQLDVESTYLKFALSGFGPGLIFMAFGAVVMVISLSTGGAERSTSSTPNAEEEVNLLYSYSQAACERLIGSSDSTLASALQTSSLPWAQRIAARIKNTEIQRQVVEALCEY